MVCVDIKKKLKPKLVIVIFERFRILRMFHVKQKKDKETARYGVKNRGSEMHHLNKTRRELEGCFT